MYEDVYAFRRKPLQEMARLDFVVSKALELTHHPRYERLIDVSEHRVQRGGALRP
jgi:hypothetical protein